MSIVEIDTVETAWSESNKHLHAKIAELANLSDSVYDNEFGGQVSLHVPVYGGEELLKFVEKRYGATYFKCHNVTFYIFPFEFKQRNNFEECTLETDTFGEVVVKYTTTETEFTFGCDNWEKVHTQTQVQRIVSIEHANGQELLFLVSPEFLLNIETRINEEVLC